MEVLRGLALILLGVRCAHYLEFSFLSTASWSRLSNLIYADALAPLSFFNSQVAYTKVKYNSFLISILNYVLKKHTLVCCYFNLCLMHKYIKYKIQYKYNLLIWFINNNTCWLVSLTLVFRCGCWQLRWHNTINGNTVTLRFLTRCMGLL